MYCSDVSTFVSFIVQKCEDPVTVDVYFEGAHNFAYSYNQSEIVDNVVDNYTGILERNATHLGFMVSVYVTECS